MNTNLKFKIIYIIVLNVLFLFISSISFARDKKLYELNKKEINIFLISLKKKSLSEKIRNNF